MFWLGQNPRILLIEMRNVLWDGVTEENEKGKFEISLIQVDKNLCRLLMSLGDSVTHFFEWSLCYIVYTQMSEMRRLSYTVSGKSVEQRCRAH